jgi:hypothetical protein
MILAMGAKRSKHGGSMFQSSEVVEGAHDELQLDIIVEWWWSGGSGMGNHEQIQLNLPFVAFVVLLYCYLDIHFIYLNYHC